MFAGLGPRVALAGATFIAAAGFLLMALPLGFAGLCAGLVLAGIGSSVQHPRASLLVTDTYGNAARAPLGIYNFAGDLGKATFPALVALLLPALSWRPTVGIMSMVGLAAAGALLALVPRRPFVAPVKEKSAVQGRSHRGFGLLLTIGVLDTSTRMGYLHRRHWRRRTGTDRLRCNRRPFRSDDRHPRRRRDGRPDRAAGPRATAAVASAARLDEQRRLIPISCAAPCRRACPSFSSCPSSFPSFCPFSSCLFSCLSSSCRRSTFQPISSPT